MKNLLVPFVVAAGVAAANVAVASETLLYLDYDDGARSVKEGADLLPFVCDGKCAAARATTNAGFWRLPSGSEEWKTLDEASAAAITQEGEELTIEFFVKGNPESFQAWQYAVTIGGPWDWSVRVDANANRQIRLCVNQSDNYGSSSSASLVDGKWHHVAVTVKPIDGGGSHVETFVDYSLQWSGNLTSGFKYGRGGIFSANRSTGGCCGGCDVDEVRFTRGALDVSEFLRLSNPLPEDGVLRVSFDDDESSVTSGADLYPYVCTAAGDDLIGGDNLGYLHLAAGSGERVFSFRHDVFLLQPDELTIEFFVKCDPEKLTAWQCPLVFGATTGSEHLFRIESDDNRLIWLKVMKEKRIANPAVSLVDGKWHHVALRVNPINDGTGCHVETYVDYAHVTYRNSQSDDITDAPFDYSMFFNRQLRLNYSNTGVDVDELKFTRGLLPTDQFMRLDPTRPPEDGETLLYLPLDGDAKTIAHPERQGDVGTTFVFADTTRTRTAVKEYGSDVTIREMNLKYCAPGALSSSYNDYWALSKAKCQICTIEFFIKGSSDVAPWATPFCYGHWTTAGNYGFVVQINSDKTIWLKPGVGSSDTGFRIPADLTKEKWHHVALTVQPSTKEGCEGGSHIEAFLDYNTTPVAANDYKNAFNGLPSGRLCFNPNGSAHCSLDELRVTKGILPVSKFLAFEKLGLILTVR